MVTYTTWASDPELAFTEIATATEYKYASATSTQLAFTDTASASMLTVAGMAVASVGIEIADTLHFATVLTAATVNDYEIVQLIDRRYARIPDNAILVEYA